MIVAIHASQGGTGKTNIAANVAAQLALRGRRVGIVDIDLQTPALHIPLGLAGLPDRTLNDFLLGNCAIDEAAYEVKMPPGQGNPSGGALYVVPSGVHSQEITKGIRRRYDITPLVALCDLLILTLTTDQKDFQGTAALLGVARELEADPILLVVNMIPPGYDHDNLRQQLERVYRCPVIAMLPLSEEMIRFGSSGLFSLRVPEDPFSRGVGEIVGRIVAGRP
jgi:septum site-determining protein MinD